MLCMIFRHDFFQNSFDFCFETKPKFQMNVTRKERQKKMKMHITEKQREKYFQRVFISLNRDLLLQNIKFDNENSRNIKKLVNVLGNDHLIEFQLIEIVIFQLIKSFNNE
jgi:hypothetical protein